MRRCCRSPAVVAVLLVVVTVCHQAQAGALPHAISKRDNSKTKPTETAKVDGGEQDAKAPSAVANAELQQNKEQKATENVQPEKQENGKVAKNDDDNSDEPRIDWRLLNGNPLKLQEELERRRRRRRNARLASLDRQHRLRAAAGGRASRAKRGAFYQLEPSELPDAYVYIPPSAYAQSSYQPDERDLANLASLIYQLQRGQPDVGGSRWSTVDDEDRVYDERPMGALDQPAAVAVLTDGVGGGDVEEDDELTGGDSAANDAQRLAFLRELLLRSEPRRPTEELDDMQPEVVRLDDDDQELYAPSKGKRAVVLLDDGRPMLDEQPAYDWARIPLNDDAYADRYNAYQLTDDQDDDRDDDESDQQRLPDEAYQTYNAGYYDAPAQFYQQALRRYQEQQLRRNIAQLIEDINEQRLQRRRR